MGDSDPDTFANITRADYDFDDEAFDNVSQDAKDFIGNLLVHRKENRLTAKQCLASTWLTQQNEQLSKIPICTDKLKKFIIRRKWQVKYTFLFYLSFNVFFFSVLHAIFGFLFNFCMFVVLLFAQFFFAEFRKLATRSEHLAEWQHYRRILDAIRPLQRFRTVHVHRFRAL